MICRSFLAELNERQQLRWSESFLGEQFRSGEKRGCGVGKTERGKGTKQMLVVDHAGVPLGDHHQSAFPSEVNVSKRRPGPSRLGVCRLPSP